MKQNKFSKNDLHSGYLVELRNREFRMVTRVGRFTKILIGKDGGWTYLSGWDDDLKAIYSRVRHITKGEAAPRYKEGDIMKIWGLVKEVASYKDALSFSPAHRDLLWERAPVKKMTLREIEDELGFSVELVSE